MMQYDILMGDVFAVAWYDPHAKFDEGDMFVGDLLAMRQFNIRGYALSIVDDVELFLLMTISKHELLFSKIMRIASIALQNNEWERDPNKFRFWNFGANHYYKMLYNYNTIYTRKYTIRKWKLHSKF